MSSVPHVASAIISHILQGNCFRRRNLPSPAFFTDYIFQSLNRTSYLQIIGRLTGRVSPPRYCLTRDAPPVLPSDLEELLHQLGVGWDDIAHPHDRKRRSLSGSSQAKVKGHKDSCSHEKGAVSQDWAEVRNCFRTLLMFLLVPSLQCSTSIQSGLLFSQSAGGHFCSRSTFTNFQGALQVYLPRHHSAAAGRCLRDCREEEERISAHCP